MPGEERTDLRITKDPRHPVAASTYAGSIVVVCDDGTAWIWAVPHRLRDQLDEHQRFRYDTDDAYRLALPHEWCQFHQPIPGTEAYAEYAT